MSNAKNPKRVLLVDDEPAVLEVLTCILQAGGYSVIAASGAEAAAECLTENDGGVVDLVLTDVYMPGKSGFDLATELSMKQPDLPVLFITGSDISAKLQMALPRIPILKKPFNGRTLLAAVQQVLNPS